MKTKPTGLMSHMNGGSIAHGGGGGESGSEWEVRPGGMLVQKRTDTDRSSIPPPTIRVRVKYGSTYHEMHISSQATFGNYSETFLRIFETETFLLALFMNCCRGVEETIDRANRIAS